MSETIRQIIDTLRQNRRQFEAFCRSLSDEELAAPVPDSTWVVRDFAAHLGTLDVPMTRWFGIIAAGGPADSSQMGDATGFDVDDFNDAQVAERRSWPFDQVLAEARQNREPLVEALERVTDEQIGQTMRFAGDRKRGPGDVPLKAFLTGWAHHDAIHASDMLKALPERAGDAGLGAWTDNGFVKGYQAAMNRPVTP